MAPSVPRSWRRFPRVLLALGCLACLAPRGLAVAGDERATRLREQIHTLENMVTEARDGTEKASLGQKLERLREELAVLEEQQKLETQERGLRENAEASRQESLRERLRDVDVSVEAAGERAAALAARHQQAAAERDALAGQAEAARQQKGDADLQAQLEERLFTKVEELRALALEREAADEEAELGRAADALRARLKGAGDPGDAANLRGLFDGFAQARAERKAAGLFTAPLLDLERNAKLSQSALDLARQKLAKDDEELALLQRQTGFLSRDAQVERLLAEQRSQKNALGERIPFLVRQVDALKRSLQFLRTRQDLAGLEAGRQEERFQALKAAWLLRLRWPAMALIGLLVLQLVSGRLLLPLFYRNESLFLARRLGRYLLTAIGVLVVFGFLVGDLSGIVTMLGVVGAGLVISLQDVCTSVFGWFVIMAGGGIIPPRPACGNAYGPGPWALTGARPP